MVSPYDAADYILFRVYEAAKQLQGIGCDRTAVVVVEGQTWFRFQLQLSDGWIDWANPRFFSADVGEGFLAKQRKRYPNLLDDLTPALRSLNAIWIFRKSEGFQYHREFEVCVNRA